MIFLFELKLFCVPILFGEIVGVVVYVNDCFDWAFFSLNLNRLCSILWSLEGMKTIYILLGYWKIENSLNWVTFIFDNSGINIILNFMSRMIFKHSLCRVIILFMHNWVDDLFEHQTSISKDVSHSYLSNYL